MIIKYLHIQTGKEKKFCLPIYSIQEFFGIPTRLDKKMKASGYKKVFHYPNPFPV